MINRQRQILSLTPHHAATLVDVLRAWTQQKGDAVGFAFWQDDKQVHLTYTELDHKARAIAVHLQAMRWQGERVLLMYPPGLELIAALMGCFYAGLVAVPVYPPRPNNNITRLLSIGEDAQAKGILTKVSLENSLKQVSKNTAFEALPKVATDSIILSVGEAWQNPQLTADSLALLQYTSGSTGTPKGVMLSHGNLLHNLGQIYQRFGHSANTHVVSWLPPYHDMGLIGGILQPLYGGFPVTLMSPVAFLQKPLRWLQAISQTQATTSGAPNFAYEMCVRNIRLDECLDLDLSSWELAFTGAEPIRQETLERFATTFKTYGFRREAFYPCYGLAEATLFVTGKNKDEIVFNHTSQSLVSCGSPSDDQTIIIVNPESREPCAAGEEGEIWLKGASVAQGYWQNPQETKATFQGALASGTGGFLRTGDLGYLNSGELFVTGRIKDVMIIRGQNYYPHDIEAAVSQCHPALSAYWGAAFSVEVDGEERLVVVQEVERSSWRRLDEDGIIAAIRGAVSCEFGLQVYGICLLKPGSIPKTSSGKVQRFACREGFVCGGLDVVFGWELAHAEAQRRREERGEEKEKIVDGLIGWLRDYANHHINSRLMDERRCISPHVVLDFGNKGLLGMQVPSCYGGLGLGYTDTIRIIQQLGAIDPTLALFVGLNNVLGVRPILMYGTDALKAELLPILATGRELAAFALTETGAGANPQAIQSQAISDGDGWLLRGEKIWSGSAAWAGVINVFVKHQQGISGFVVRRGSPGLRQGAEALTMGMRGMVQNTVYLEDIPVTSAQVLGEVGKGMNVAQDAMMYGRLAIASACVGGMQRCVQLMWRYSQRRQIATGKLLDHPIVLHRLQELTCAITVVQSLVMRVGKLLDAGETVPAEVYAACKISAPEFYWQAADLLVQTLGGRGYIESNIAPQILRDARVLRIFEGPTETLCGFLGARVLKQGETLQNFLCQTLGAVEVGTRLRDAVDKIRGRCFDGANITVQRWVYHQVGKLATEAILWAVLDDKSAINWVKHRFDEQLQEILSFNTDNLLFLNGQSLVHHLNEYTKTIGDIEQNLAGEAQELDELLRQSGENPQFIPTTADLPASSEIQTWLKTWISQKLRQPISTIDVNRAFAEYGMDSVTAIELTQDLQEWLKISQPLDATIAWNFPTINALANYLGEVTKENAVPSDNNLDDLSTTDIAQLLSQEIAIARHRKPQMK
ncbi:AMP-binding protein [Anabaena sp. FACHB-709]|uniref:AMP-binding protein n=2 Tax=Nostocaceae TaxID=1162 RepID=A0ABR7ZRP5_ANACY|nr:MULTISPECIES: AMP-binding protein [Nostocaceae]BAY68298.1 putative acyl-CoA synthase [Trichormus variabilis NIES-23]HBW32187.1 AMP-dependent synthetase [Nostoc sp. UBA8866]MBD2174863.1 AMP-binding protein [Anabaena cylindrica FACHB-318]MBD2266628.1 AMP-binding protein [Anabaena sp. FACHB-709]MBD2276215.1 AMP-binding protein [Nostoc sp. PCC 7120 = FACHB-418]